MTYRDVPRAHPRSPTQRCTQVTIDGATYRLLRALYGLRDAGAAFDQKVEEGLSLRGFALGKLSPGLAHDAGDGAPPR